MASLFGTSGIAVLMRLSVCVCVSKSFTVFVSIWFCSVEVEAILLLSVVTFLLLSFLIDNSD